MSYKEKSALYFVSFAIAIATYYNVGQTNAKDLSMEKEMTKTENQIVASPNATDFSNLQ